jgi:iron complex outermembrane receptor protein
MQMKMFRLEALKKCFALLVLSLIWVGLSHPQAYSLEENRETSVETAPEREKTYMKIGTITVTEELGYLPTADIPGSIDVIGSDQLEDENVDFSMQALKKLPGVFYQDWNQGVIHGTISLRGFDPNTDTAVRLNVDGIPNNLASGYMDLRPFFPFEIDRIELVKGTFDPRYGLNYVGGNVNVVTKKGGNYTQVKLLGGSFDTYQGDTVVAREEDGFSQTYFASYRRSDGYREHSDVKKGAVSGKWFYRNSDDRLSVGLIARVFDMDANAPGYLTKQEFENDPQQMQDFSRTDGGEQNNKQASVHLDYRFKDRLLWSFKTYTQGLERSRWVRFSEAGSQQERRTEETQSGAISTLTYETSDWGVEQLRLMWGVDFQYQKDLYQRFTTVDRVRQGDPFRHWDYNQGFWGSYLQCDGKVSHWLRLMGALRVDDLFGEFEDKVNDTESDMIDYDLIWQPKIGTVITPYEGYNLFANYGRTFQVGWNSRFDAEADTDYSKNEGWEVGIKASPVNWLASRVAYWQQIRSDEVVTNAQGDPENLGETERKGWDLELNLKPHEWVTIWGSYSYVDAEFTDPGPNNPERKGKDLKNIPNYAARIGLDLEHPSGFSGRVWLESQDDYYVDYLNELAKAGDYNVVNLDLKYDFQPLIVGFQVRNLFDEDYAGFVWYQDWGTPEVWYSPGDERSYYAYVSFEF